MLNIDNKNLRSFHLNGIYKDFAELLGVEVTLQIYENYKGLQVTFPTRLFSKEYVRKQIKQQYNKHNAKDLARMYQYSERWIKVLVSEDDDLND